MTISHVNDSYFWVVSQMSKMDTKTALRSHTLGTLIQGLVGFIILFVCYTVWINHMISNNEGGAISSSLTFLPVEVLSG